VGIFDKNFQESQVLKCGSAFELLSVLHGHWRCIMIIYKGVLAVPDTFFPPSAREHSFGPRSSFKYWMLPLWTTPT
jgi:hypothetical protein